MKKALTVIALIGLLAGSAAAQDWKLGVQTYSFRKFTFCETIDTVSKMGVKYVEAYSKQEIGGGIEGKTDYKMDAATRDAIKAKLAAAGVEIISYGVIKGKDEADWRAIFDFAKAMGFKTIVSEPLPEHYDLLVKLCKEYGIDIAIHNHAEPTPYWKPETTLAACKGREGIYGSPDNGHWARSGINSIDGFKLLEGNMKSIHIKDMAVFGDVKAKDCVPLGEGVCDMPAVFAELKRQNYKGAFILEYESEPENPAPSIKKCVDYFNAQAGDLAKPSCCSKCNACTAKKDVFTKNVNDLWKDVDISKTGWDKIPEPPKAAPKKKPAKKKTVKKQTPAKQTPAKKAPAKKTTAKKQTAKKPAANKEPAKPQTLEQYLQGSQKWCAQNNKEWNKEKATKAFHRMDTDKDGILTPKEKATGKKKQEQNKKKQK
ncbi:MAG: TIM barrel protein [Kiritimatiellales bacterium]|nr:TIM barrel protein [Kiritimatiellales bacterium]